MSRADDFVHLNVHSDYSLQKSIASISGIASRVAEIGQSAVALTDEGNLFGAAEFTKACREAGVRPIIGCELWIAPDRKKNDTREKSSLIVLCKNTAGFLNAKKLSSAGFLEGFYYVPRVDMELLAQHTEGLACIVPQFGSDAAQAYELGQSSRAEEKLAALKDLFGENLFLELQNHGQTSEYQLNAQLAAAAKKFGIRLVAGNDCHYLEKPDAFAHGVFIKNNTLERREFYSDEYYIKSAQEMRAFLKEYPAACDTTLSLSKDCAFEMVFPGPQLPAFPIPPQFTSADAYLRSLVFEGLAKKYPAVSEDIRSRAEYELGIIEASGYSGYFLIVWDIISFANRSGIPVGLGRGSAAGSIAAYALGITGIDPLKYGLLFERFLNPERISMPDIDTDFCVDGRQNVINYIREKYGDERVGQIITFSSLKPRGALRDVARALEFTADEADEIAKLIPDMSKSMDEARSLEPKLADLKDKRHAELFEITDKILGVHRHSSLHAAGVVIGNAPLIDYVPLYKDAKTGAVATQYTMDYLEECGLVKIDVLGLRTVTILAKAEQEIQKKDPNFSLEHIPEADAATFAALSEGKADAVFQFESPGMQRALRRVRPTQVTDLIALNALYRPGPMEHIETYAEVKHGRRAPEYHLDALKSVLEETYGVIVYQEQVMNIARIIAGYSLGNADILRRVMGKKKKDEMKLQLQKFVDGAVQNGYEKRTAEDIFKLLEPFAGYGFNKSHAAAYGVLAYRTAYVKQHYPQIFFMCQLNAIASHPDSVTKNIRMAQSAGLRVLGPDVNVSEYEFTVEGDALRYGLNAVKTISEDNKRGIPEERKAGGAYSSVINVLERLAENRGMERFLEAAIPAGLFDSIDPRRALLYANRGYFAEEGRARFEARKDRRTLLFSEHEDEDVKTRGYPVQTEDASALLREREYIGVYLSAHPLDPIKNIWEKETTLDLSALRWEASSSPSSLGDGGRFGAKPNHYLVCYIDSVRERLKDHEKIYSGLAEDYRGGIEFVYRAKTAAAEPLADRTVCALVGQLGQREDGFVFWVSSVIHDLAAVHAARSRDAKSAPVAAPKLRRRLHVGFRAAPSEEELSRIRARLLDNFGKASVVFHVPKRAGAPPEERDAVHLPQGFTVKSDDAEFAESLRALPFVDAVWYA